MEEKYDLSYTFKVDNWFDLFNDQDERIKNEQVKIDAVIKRQKRKEKLERINKEL